ncbi:hypothetical protein RHMOL_Rhmol09G0101800 [Rhododendron molle]|uniref:Uncharacterized protein n=1 Tax=Rhododendron molle TaxID=49168 RepID=A0ACC0MBS2_RHOML|nr:hypothetical protein RHMOL_Rhmol09G0101800 [Rhododendron molle]
MRHWRLDRRDKAREAVASRMGQRSRSFDSGDGEGIRQDSRWYSFAASLPASSPSSCCIASGDLVAAEESEEDSDSGGTDPEDFED